MGRFCVITCAMFAGCLLLLLSWSRGPASEDFQQALQPRAFRFPADHADHPGFQTEWWYYTGNLVTEKGRAFGYQLTFFRVQLKPGPAASGSPWRSNQVYFAHCTLSDLENRKFLAAEKAGRGAVGIAGVSSEDGRIRIFLHNWESLIKGRVHHLRGNGEEFSLSLELVSEKPPVLHGDQGLSRKGSGPSQASYYYSLTRMSTRGVLTLNSERFAVSGSSWMDHEFTSNVLSQDQAGWDWMGLQLSGSRELMLYTLRQNDGSADPHSSGTLVRADGTAVHLPGEAFAIRPTGSWESPGTGARYPSGWQVKVPGHGIRLEVTPNLKDQELVTGESTQVTYWEGSVSVSGQAEGEPVTGAGYVELTGYAERFDISYQ